MALKFSQDYWNWYEHMQLYGNYHYAKFKNSFSHSVHKKAKKNLHTPESIISLNYTHKSQQQQFVWVGAHACNKYTKFEFDWRTTRKYNLSWFLITPVA